MLPNKVSANINETVKKEILDAIETINKKLPFLVALTPSERRELPKMGARTQMHAVGSAGSYRTRRIHHTQKKQCSVAHIRHERNTHTHARNTHAKTHQTRHETHN